MKAFIAATVPRSINASRKDHYIKELRRAYQVSHGSSAATNDKLYGLVYHFWNRDIRLDADNLSKPVWDALKGLAYVDDAQILFRVAASVEVVSGELQGFDLTNLPDDVAETMLEKIGTSDHLVYVEIGPFRPTMIRFGLEFQNTHEKHS